MSAQDEPPLESDRPSTILLVDDDETNLGLLTATLEPQGHRLLIAKDGVQALESVSKELPDLILLDVMMPGMDGFEVCQRLKSSSETRDIPIILITALNDTRDYIEGIEKGADDFMTKPFNAAILKARVRGYLKTKHLRDEIDELVALKVDLTRMIIHDLNNPLCGILGYVDLLETVDEPLPTQVLRYIQGIDLAGRNAVTLIKNLIDLEKVESGTLRTQPEPTNLSDLIEEASSDFLPLLNAEDCQVVFLGDGSIPCLCDRQFIHRVIQNLVGNASKFAPSKSNIIIDWGAENGEVFLSVANHGPILPADQHEKIFKKFYQIEDRPEIARRGCGLGLAFCRMAVEAHGGSISVVSPPLGWEDGVRFEIRFPQNTSEQQSVKRAESR